MTEFFGNASIVASLARMLAEDRLPQTMLFAGPEGVGKATLARRAAAALLCERGQPDPCGTCSHCRRVLEADLSLPHYQKLVEERARLPLERRRDNPLIVSTHPEFLCFPPDGPLAQISIEQVRKLQEHARFGPSQGRRRLFLLDHADQMDAAAANSLLKTLEEPPPYLILILTAANPYRLLPTIRSRAVPFWFAPLGEADMQRFLAGRPDIPDAERARRLAWAQGCPGRVVSIDSAAYQKRREAMLVLLETAAGAGSFGDLLRHTEVIGRSKLEKIEALLDVFYGLLRDLAGLRIGPGQRAIVNEDVRGRIEAVAAKVDYAWLDSALAQMDELDRLVRRNIQKQIALEAVAVTLRGHRPAARAPDRG